MSTPSSAARPSILWLGLGAVTIALMLADLYMIFVYAPFEARMGIVQKIFYFHVPSAYCMYVGFGLCGIASAGYLIRRTERWDAFAVAGAEIGLLFVVIVLITGPIWGRKAWGVWWTWDPRLTTTMLAGMIFAAYVVLRSFGDAGEAERRFASALAIVGLFILPIIHYSVQRWRGTHPTVITSRGGGLAPEMTQTLLFSLLTFTFLVAWLIWTRVRHERMRQELVALEVEAAERGLLEDA
ncbi:MAG: cytochrome c biogenesis protein CcsA [Myxococcales bacterium]|nr:cytochrome c biogenesis protein CcsA [Myxococcales bacterium]